jgi:hypothetical protein
MKNKLLPLDAKVTLLEKMAEDFEYYLSDGGETCPREQTYRFCSRDEDREVVRVARGAALESLSNPITKVAFDTRRVDQLRDRNPRQNLQYYHRTDPFIDEEDDDKLNRFARLLKVLNGIQKDFGTQPEWFESYARQLHDSVTRILRVKQADLDVFKPQLFYLEQLLDARYRITMDQLKSMPTKELRARILSKDEPLLKRGAYIKETGGPEESRPIVVDGQTTTQDSIVNAIFGGNNLRKDGERTVERTVTITIKDNVLDDQPIRKAKAPVSSYDEYDDEEPIESRPIRSKRGERRTPARRRVLRSHVPDPWKLRVDDLID